MEFVLVNLGDNLSHPDGGAAPTDEAKHLGLIEQAVFAEQMGFDGFLLGEHHFNYFTISSPMVVLAAIAQRTQRLRLGTGVTLMPTRDAVLVAEEAATLDVLSGGRAEVGVGRGIHHQIYEVMDRPEAQASEMLAEGLELLHRLLTETDVTWSGRWRPGFEHLTIRPRPVHGSVPVWSGSTSALELSARLGVPCMWVATVYPYERLAEVAQQYLTHWLAAGRSKESYQVGIGVHCHLARTSQEAHERFRPHFAHYFEASASIAKSNLVRAVQPTARDASLFNAVPFCGSPAEIIDRIGAARDLLGLTRVALVIDLGGLRQSEVLEQIALLGEEVLPAFVG